MISTAWPPGGRVGGLHRLHPNPAPEAPVVVGGGQRRGRGNGGPHGGPNNSRTPGQGAQAPSGTGGTLGTSAPSAPSALLRPVCVWCISHRDARD